LTNCSLACKNILTVGKYPIPSAKPCFPCPLCLTGLNVRESKKGKPYLVCDPCGVQMFVRAEPGIRRLTQLVADPDTQGILERLKAREAEYRKQCPKCGHKFWVTENLTETSWFNGKLTGYKCPECGEIVKSEIAK
jgi:DNA-directed RNA polymerase subunit M/transcription elongation factor TFIIS